MRMLTTIMAICVHVFVFYFLLIAFSILVYMLFSYSAFRLQECSIKSVSQSVSQSVHRYSGAIFGKVSRIANEDVLLQLLSSICMPSLMYGLEACSLVKSDLLSLDFVINRFFMKLFKTNNIDVVKTCHVYFNFEMPSTLWMKRSTYFNNKFLSCQNLFVKSHCTLFNICTC